MQLLPKGVRCCFCSARCLRQGRRGSIQGLPKAGLLLQRLHASKIVLVPFVTWYILPAI